MRVIIMMYFLFLSLLFHLEIFLCLLMLLNDEPLLFFILDNVLVFPVDPDRAGDLDREDFSEDRALVHYI